MIIEHNIRLSYMCPACGNYYYGSGVRSYNTFGATVFSDGYSRACYNPFWLTRCPRCKQFFAKEHLFKLPRAVESDFRTAGLLRLTEKTQDQERRGFFEQMLKQKLEEEKLYGRLDGYFTEEETKIDFIHKAIKQGQYFPITVAEWEKPLFKVRLHKDLWHEYNMHRDKISDEVYLKLCGEIIDMLEGKERLTPEDILTLAELYRNIGEFEKCILILNGSEKKKGLAEFADAIRMEAEKNNSKTVTVIEGNW